MELSRYSIEELKMAYMGFGDPELAILPLAKGIAQTLADKYEAVGDYDNYSLWISRT